MGILITVLVIAIVAEALIILSLMLGAPSDCRTCPMLDEQESITEAILQILVESIPVKSIPAVNKKFKKAGLKLERIRLEEDADLVTVITNELEEELETIEA